MVKRPLIFVIIFFVVVFVSNINFVYADESDYTEAIVAKTVKYYKTITYYYSNIAISDSEINGKYSNYTVEISENEYNNAELVNLANSSSSETTYKKMTVTISQSGDYYKYMAVLDWKKIPSKRSYDVISLSYYSNVSIFSSTTFSLYYCNSSGTCNTRNNGDIQYFSNGVGVSFKLPTGSLSTLQAKFYFNVQKNTSGTILSQKAVADYAHATSTVSLSESKNYSVNLNGISFNDDVGDNYDSMNATAVSWSGSW